MSSPTPLLSDDEIRRRLREIRFTPAALRNARKAPSINGIAVAAGLNREHVSRIAAGLPIGSHSRAALSQALTCAGNGSARKQSRGPD